MHIDDYVEKFLLNKHFRNNQYCMFIKNCYTIEDVEGNLSSAILKKAILRAFWDRKMRYILTDILLCNIDGNSITNENFSLLLKFRGRRKKIYLSNIAHTKLAFYQMQIINRISGDFDVFGRLFDIICENELFNKADMISILRDNASVTIYGIQVCIDIAAKKYGVSEKLKVAAEWVESQKTGDGLREHY